MRWRELLVTKESFYELLTNSHQINYFGASLQDEVQDTVNESKPAVPASTLMLKKITD